MISKNIESLEKELEEGSGIMMAVATAVFNEKNQILLGKRLSEAGFGSWHMPGGHLKTNETIADCARREICEELGEDFEVEITKEIIAVRENRVAPQFIHHVAVFVKGIHISGIAKVNEPEKCERWEWFNLEDLPKPMFSGEEEILQNFMKGNVMVASDW